jgi:hypothetical protein
MAQSHYLHEQADRCRRLAHGTSDVVTRDRLLILATEYEQRADAVAREDDRGTGRSGSGD